MVSFCVAFDQKFNIPIFSRRTNTLNFTESVTDVVSIMKRDCELIDCFLSKNHLKTFRRKKQARAAHDRSQMAKTLRGHKAKLYHKKRYSEKVEMRKLLKQHEEKEQKNTVEQPDKGAVPAYLLDRQQQTTGTVLSNMIKQKRKQKAVSIKIINIC